MLSLNPFCVHLKLSQHCLLTGYTTVCVCVCVCYLLSCVQLYNPMDCSPSGSSVHGILQARTLE